MPNRLLKEGICTSNTLNEISPEAEIFFYRLLVVADDFGLMDARPAILRSQCFPLRNSVTVAAVITWVGEMAKAGLLKLYAVDSRPFLKIMKWQQRQRSKAKYPPDDNNSLPIDSTMLSDDGLGLGLGLGLGTPDVSVSLREPSTSGDGDITQPPTKPKPTTLKTPLANGHVVLGDGDLVESINLIGTGIAEVHQTFADELAALYPNVDVPQTLREIRGWMLANPTRRKTPKGIARSINGWMAKEQNRG